MQPSGILPVACKVVNPGSGWVVERASVYRTQRRLFEGRVLIPSS
jgi:2-methylaconitate cis-trans-isomerase PrpF